MTRQGFIAAAFLIGTVGASGVFIGGSSCYYHSSDKETFNSARRKCQERQGNLVVIETEQEQSILQDHFRNDRHSFWVGGILTDNKTEFSWLSNITIEPALWLPGKPDSKGECVRFRVLDGKRGLANCVCDLLVRYICEQGIDALNNSCAEPSCTNCTTASVPYQLDMPLTQQNMTSSGLKCSCVCTKPVLRVISRRQAAEQYAHLRIYKKSTGNSIRKLTSASDPRTSSTVIGYSAIIFVIIIPAALIVLNDARTIYMVIQNQ